jgi:hypothetical protein
MGAMNGRGPDADDGGENPLGWFFGALVGVAVAIACFTPIWDEAMGQGGGRRAGFAALLEAMGPFGVAGVALVIAAVFLWLGVRSLRRP